MMKEYKIISMHIEYFETEKLKALTISPGGTESVPFSFTGTS